MNLSQDQIPGIAENDCGAMVVMSDGMGVDSTAIRCAGSLSRRVGTSTSAISSSSPHIPATSSSRLCATWKR